MLKTGEQRNKKIINRIRLTTNHLLFTKNGQVILEFTFCMIIILLMIFGATKVFHWTGRDLVERQRAHDEVLRETVPPRQQIDPYFYTPTKINAIYKEP